MITKSIYKTTKQYLASADRSVAVAAVSAAREKMLAASEEKMDAAIKEYHSAIITADSKLKSKGL